VEDSKVPTDVAAEEWRSPAPGKWEMVPVAPPPSPSRNCPKGRKGC